MKLSSELIIPGIKKNPSQIVKSEVKKVCTYFKINPKLLNNKTRCREVVIPRWICMHRLRNIHGFSYDMTGMAFNRTHVTARNACLKIDFQKETYSDIKQYLKDLS